MMERREFIGAISTLTASVGLAGCATTSGNTERVRETIARNVPGTEKQSPPKNVRPTDSERIELNNIQFQRPGQKGVAVAGDATNQSDQTFKEFYVEVTLYDKNEAKDDVLDTFSSLTEHDGFKSGQSWQWAVTFRNQVLPDLGYYSVTAVGTVD